MIKKFGNYNFIVEQILKFKTLSQLVRTNAYVRSFLPIIWKRLQIKKCTKNCSKFKNLQLHYIVQFQIQSASTKMPKISKPKASLNNKIVNSKCFYNFKIVKSTFNIIYYLNDSTMIIENSKYTIIRASPRLPYFSSPSLFFGKR